MNFQIRKATKTKGLSCLYQALLLNIPGWDWRRDDQAVCLNEVKYGLLAQVSDTLIEK